MLAANPRAQPAASLQLRRVSRWGCLGVASALFLPLTEGGAGVRKAQMPLRVQEAAAV